MDHPDIAVGGQCPACSQQIAEDLVEHIVEDCAVYPTHPGRCRHIGGNGDLCPDCVLDRTDDPALDAFDPYAAKEA